MSESYRAKALLDIGATKITEARSEVKIFTLASATFGPLIASWAVADNRKRTQVHAEIASWAKSKAPTCVISGIPGLGKTAASARWAGSRGALMIRAAVVTGWPWGGGAELATAMRAPVLMIDDLGRETAHGQAPELLIDLVCQRHDAGRLTLATCMGARQVIAARYPDHMCDRIGEHWVNLKKGPGTFRGNGIDPVLVKYKQAREVVRLAHHVGNIASGVGSEAPADCIDMLTALLGADADAVAASAESMEQETRANYELFLDMSKDWGTK